MDNKFLRRKLFEHNIKHSELAQELGINQSTIWRNLRTSPPKRFFFIAAEGAIRRIRKQRIKGSGSMGAA